MSETNLRPNAQSVIPDDPEASAYRFIIVAAKRARQLQNGFAMTIAATALIRPTRVSNLNSRSTPRKARP